MSNRERRPRVTTESLGGCLEWLLCRICPEGGCVFCVPKGGCRGHVSGERGLSCLLKSLRTGTAYPRSGSISQAVYEFWGVTWASVVGGSSGC